MAAWLKSKEEEWESQAKQAKEGPKFTEIPDGKYIARLTKGEIGESQSSGRAQIAWGYTILVGEQQGELIRDYDGLEKEDAFLWIARKLARFGYDPEQVKLSRLPSVLEELVEKGPICRVQLRTKKDFQNAIILKVFEDGYDPTEDGEEGIGDSEPEMAGTGESTEEQVETSPDGDDDGSGELVDIEVGMKAKFKRLGKDVVGDITAIDEETGMVTLMVGTKEHQVQADKLELVAEGLDG